jgi:hypothetical protein
MTRTRQDNEHQPGEQREANASDAQSQTGHESEDATTAFAAFATQAIAQGIQNLHIDPQLLDLGQHVMAASKSIVGPLRKAFKMSPALIGTGVASIAVGGALIGLALVRDANVNMPRQLKPKFEN